MGEENLVVEGREPHERGLTVLHAMIQFSGRWGVFPILLSNVRNEDVYIIDVYIGTFKQAIFHNRFRALIFEHLIFNQAILPLKSKILPKTKSKHSEKLMVGRLSASSFWGCRQPILVRFG